MFRFFFFTLVCCVAVPNVWSQTSQKYSSEYASFYRGEELFEKEQYSAAKKTFSTFIDGFNDKNDPQYIKARYYEGLAALALYNNDGIQLLMKFNHDFPENIYKNSIYFKIGQHYYQTKKYQEATEWFERTDISQIDTSHIAEYHFKLGYAYFQLGEFSTARNHLFEVKEGESKYAAPAMYYFSHISYQNETYQTALEGFLTLTKNATFKDEVAYYIIQIYYLQGDYERIIEFAPGPTDISSKELSPEMNLLIGDAYFKTERYDESVYYLENYSAKGTPKREDDYQLGYAYMKSTNFDKAIKKFDQVSRIKDKLGQVALYHAAECYLKKEELNYARAAFQGAAAIDEDETIQEDALYNYAVLSYQMDYNPYNEAILAFELFLEKFPNSKRKEDVFEYLVNVYTNTKKYDAALASLNRIENKDIKLKTAYQVIAYNRGVEAFERSNYSAVVQAMDDVSTYPIDPRLVGKSYFWQAEALYMLKQYDKAIQKYKSFLNTLGNDDSHLKAMAYYNIAYCYYDNNDFVSAIEAFRTYTKSPYNKDKLRTADAFLRIGDAYYSKQDPEFEQAAIHYEEAVNLKQQNLDRALFYLAKVYGFIPERRIDKITTLLDIINNHRGSKYTVPSIFEIGISYKHEGDYSKAFTYLNQILVDYPKNTLVKDALIEIGDIKYKQKEFSEAESFFNRVLSEFDLPDSVCRIATTGLRDIYRATKQQERIAEIAEQYACAKISDDDQEEFYYETANELYLKNNYNEAIPEINKYLEVYPEGRFSTQLISYLADIYYQKDEKGQALVLYEQIIGRQSSAYTEEALIRASKILYNEGKYERALPHYTKLASFASTPQVVYNTRIGLMRCNFLLKSYKNAALAAKKVLKDAFINESIKIEANYVAGKSLFKLKNYEEALPYLKWTEENTGAERGTEALHLLAETYFNLKNYEEAEKIHKRLLQRKPAYDFWIAKSLILQAKTFMAKDDLFQAEKTIDLVLNNYPDENDGVLIEANKFKSELMQLKEKPELVHEPINRIIEIEEKGDDE